MTVPKPIFCPSLCGWRVLIVHGVAIDVEPLPEKAEEQAEDLSRRDARVGKKAGRGLDPACSRSAPARAAPCPVVKAQKLVGQAVSEAVETRSRSGRQDLPRASRNSCRKEWVSRK